MDWQQGVKEGAKSQKLWLWEKIKLSLKLMKSYWEANLK